MSADGQGTKCRRNIAENFNRLSRVHEGYRQTDRQTDRQTTDGQATAISEREREFTFAKKPEKALTRGLTDHFSNSFPPVIVNFDLCDEPSSLTKDVSR